MFTLDTNILIYDAAEDPGIVSFLESHRSDIYYLPSIVVLEFLSYPLILPGGITRFKSFLSQTILLNLDLTIAEQAAEIRRKYRIELADAVIASSAILTNSTLVTRNVKDFKRIKGLSIVAP